mmetsp:Transcript_102007/g.141834  ORF Transcript_102007/g.141834 Transcript_102007/m.141834 type:complete len:163 (+) Transcript_102007:214-702(+)
MPQQNHQYQNSFSSFNNNETLSNSSIYNSDNNVSDNMNQIATIKQQMGAKAKANKKASMMMVSSGSSSSGTSSGMLVCTHPGCGKSYNYKSDLEKHMITHSDAKPFACTFPGCDKRYKRSDALKNHYRLHTDEKPFLCTVPGCEQRFRSRCCMDYHLKKHQT